MKLFFSLNSLLLASPVVLASTRLRGTKEKQRRNTQSGFGAIAFVPKQFTTNELFQAVREFKEDPIAATIAHGPIENWDVSQVTDMTFLFFESDFNADISRWNVGNVVTMVGMFAETTKFNIPIGQWDVRNVVDMQGMFDGAKAFNQDISNWDTSKVERMLFMFRSATSFNQGFDLDTSSVEDVRDMFNGASKFSQELCLDLGSVKEVTRAMLANTDAGTVIDECCSVPPASGFANLAGDGTNGDKLKNSCPTGSDEEPTLLGGGVTFGDPITLGDEGMTTETDQGTTLGGSSGESTTISIGGEEEPTMGGDGVTIGDPITLGDEGMTTETDQGTTLGGSSGESTTISIGGEEEPTMGGDGVTIGDPITLGDEGMTTETDQGTTLGGPSGESTTISIGGEEEPTVGGDGVTIGDPITLGDEGMTTETDQGTTLGGPSGESTTISIGGEEEPTVGGDGVTIGDPITLGDEGMTTETDQGTTLGGSSGESTTISIGGEEEPTMGGDGVTIGDPITLGDEGMTTETDQGTTLGGPSGESTTISTGGEEARKQFTTNELFLAVEEFKEDPIAATIAHGPMEDWDVSQVTDMTMLFFESDFNVDISRWNVGNVVTMGGMFAGTTNFNIPIGQWDVRNVVDMQGMFDGAKAFNQDISNWDTSKVERMLFMFRSATSFNQGFDLDTSSVEDVRDMFNGATKFNQELCLDLGSVKEGTPGMLANTGAGTVIDECCSVPPASGFENLAGDGTNGDKLKHSCAPPQTESPTTSPTQIPTVSPTTSPTQSPTNAPSFSPTGSPTKSPMSIVAADDTLPEVDLSKFKKIQIRNHQVSSLCLDLKDGVARQGGRMNVERCSFSKASQVWFTDTSGSIRSGKDTNLCLTAPASGRKNTALTLETCDASNQRQIWSELKPMRIFKNGEFGDMFFGVAQGCNGVVAGRTVNLQDRLARFAFCIRNPTRSFCRCSSQQMWNFQTLN